MPTFTTYDPETHTLDELVAAIFTATTGVTLVEGSVSVRHGTPAGESSTLSFYDGTIQGLNIGAGLLLTSGDPTPPLDNTASGHGTDAGGDEVDAIDSDLQATVDFAFPNAGSVKDVTYLEFQINVTDETVKGISFDVVFGSEEYPEFSGSSFVDVAGVYVNGINYALFAGDPKKPLSVVSANLNKNWKGVGLNGYFRDNRDANETLAIEYDGVSVKLQVTAQVNQGLNTIKIAIADTGDSALDSGIFISNVHGTSFAGFGIAQQVFVPDTGLIDIPGNQIYFGGDNGTVVEFSSAGGGYDIFNGGGGIDTAKFEEPLGAVSYAFNAQGSIVITYAGDDTVELTSVEHLWFGDGVYFAMDTAVGDNTYVVYSMLNAWFNGAPDITTLSQWVARSLDMIQAGLGYTELGDAIIATYRDTPYLEDIVARLYTNIIGSAPDTATVNALTGLIGYDQMFVSAGELLAYGASLSANTSEISGMVGTIMPLEAGFF